MTEEKKAKATEYVVTHAGVKNLAVGSVCELTEREAEFYVNKVQLKTDAPTVAAVSPEDALALAAANDKVVELEGLLSTATSDAEKTASEKDDEITDLKAKLVEAGTALGELSAENAKLKKAAAKK